MALLPCMGLDANITYKGGRSKWSKIVLKDGQAPATAAAGAAAVHNLAQYDEQLTLDYSQPMENPWSIAKRYRRASISS
ncbi:MAG: hypothetical protein Q9198_010595, partial [Flavoplaca austrocitrina]